MATISKEFLKEFIEIFKNNPALWDIKSEAYKNNNLKNKGWKALLNKYKDIDKNATVELAKRKINVLRTSYRRELNKVRENEQYEFGPDEEYIPSLWYFDLLDFLRDHMMIKESKRSCDDPLEIYKVQKLMEDQAEQFIDDPLEMQRKSIEEQYTESVDDSFEVQKPCSSKKRKAIAHSFQLKTVTNCENSQQLPVRDEADVFAEGWAIIYRQLNADQKIFAKRIIDEALMLGQFGQLTYGSVKCLDSAVPVNLQKLTHVTPPPSMSTMSTPTANDEQIFSPSSTLLSEENSN